MYESFFGLKNAPFRITPDTQTFFGGGRREELLNALVYTVERGEGMVKVVGEVGSGKTTLLRKLAVQLSEQRVWLVYINSPNMPASDILMFICHELGLPCESGEPKFKVVERLQKRLLQAHATSRKVVLLIDEAQSMPLETLEELRLLSNLETDTDKLLQIVMFGQPELDRLIDNPEIRQIRDRVAFELQIEPFSMSELTGYLNFRMRVAGYIGNDLFTRKVVKEIYRFTGGYPRRVNLLADKVLLAAFSAGVRQLDRRQVLTAQGAELPSVLWPRVMAVTVFVLLLAAAGAGYHYGWSGPFNLEVAARGGVDADAKPSGDQVLPPPVAAVTDSADQQMKWNSLNTETLDWAQGSLQQGEQFTLQLMSLERTQALKTLSHYNSKYALQLRVYGFEVSQKPLAVVLSGSYSTPEDARQALSNLPDALVSQYRPFVRALDDIRTELEQQLADGQPHI